MPYSSTLRTVLPVLTMTGLLAMTGCPSSVETGTGSSRAQPDESDPRVIRDEHGNLYAADAKNAPKPDEAAADALGFRRPDESNGVCRLYSPRYPTPECCASEFGLDAEAVARICGYDIYQGEHQRNYCGYYFRKGDKDVPFRAKFLSHLPDAKAAAEDHDRFIRVRFKQEGFASTPVTGVPGAFTSNHEGTHWLHVDGWKHTREFLFKDGFCDGHLPEIAKMLREAPEPPEGAERTHLVPKPSAAG